MTFEIETKPYETEKVYKRRSFELNPGITILVGCNGAGKSTMLRYIFSKLKKENIPYEFYDNLSDGGNQAMSAAGFYGDMDLLVNLATMSEGESIVMNYTQFAGAIGRMIRNNPDSKRYFVLMDAVDSGMSIDNIMKIKKFLIDILARNELKGKELYLVSTANTYEMACDLPCLSVQDCKYIEFKSYEDYKNYILKTRETKEKWYDKYYGTI